jgi:dTDP-4-amino-4,6-dideoxygalactose transaminase
MSDIPLDRCCATSNELQYITQVISNGCISGGGVFTRKCEKHLRDELGASSVLLTTSCTSALDMSALLIDVQPGDEIIVPSFTFVSTANAFALRGARLVFCDVRRDTLNIDESALQPLITARTRAIVPVHYAGVGCEMDRITRLAREQGVRVIEDNAHGLFGRYKSQYLGTFGCLATLSFDRAKNLTCGEGGALIINEEELAGRAEVIRDKGTNRSAFMRGEINTYSWIDMGSNYFLSELQAAFLNGQLEARNEIQHRRRKIWRYYDEHLAGWSQQAGVARPSVPDHCVQSYHLYYLMMPSAATRNAFIQYLNAQGIASAFHYLPLHLSDMGRRFGGVRGDCPVAEDISERIVRLPFFNDLSTDDLDRIINAVTSFGP